MNCLFDFTVDSTGLPKRKKESKGLENPSSKKLKPGEWKLESERRATANLKFQVRELERNTEEGKKTAVKKFVDHLKAEVIPDYLGEEKYFGLRF